MHLLTCKHFVNLTQLIDEQGFVYELYLLHCIYLIYLIDLTDSVDLEYLRDLLNFINLIHCISFSRSTNSSSQIVDLE